MKDVTYNSSISPEIRIGSRIVSSSPSGSSIKGSKSKLNKLSVQPSAQSSLIDCNGISNQIGVSLTFNSIKELLENIIDKVNNNGIKIIFILCNINELTL